MTRIKTKVFFAMHHIDCNDEVIEKYNNGWTLEEIRKGVEFRKNNFLKEKENFKKYRF